MVRASLFTKIIIAVAACLALVGFWFVNEAANTLSHIFPGRSLPQSSSMEPYELSFKKASESGVVDEWKLAIPRAFVVDQTGKNGDVAPWTGTNTGYFSATVKLLRNKDGQFVPETAVDNPHTYSKQNRIVIHLINARADSWIVKGDLCVPQHLFKEQAERFRMKSISWPCYDQSNACSVTTHMDGWAVGMAATKDLYSNPQEVCEIAKKFLNTYTVSRSSISQRQ